MPILHIRALPQRDPAIVEGALKRTCAAIAVAYSCPPEHVWATWEEIKPGHYVEGSNSAAIQPATSHPPVAELLCVEGRSPREIEKVLVAAAKTLCASLGLPGNIFISYRELKSGEIAAGDGLIWKK